MTDGDTITLLDAARIQHKIRLSGIDAPEKTQPFGQRSKENLASAIFRKLATVDWEKVDRYGRIVGKVVVDGRDANLMQVQSGLAWHYKQYAREQSLKDASVYSEAEDRARAAREGLWARDDAIAPWNYRKLSRRSLKCRA